MPSLVLDITTTAAILYVVALGLLLIFGVMKIINFAHGAFLTVGGYSAVVTTGLGLDPWLSLPLAAAAGVLLGMVVERLIVRPLYDRPLDAILATWGLGIILGQVITLVFGREVQFAESPVQGTTEILGAPYSQYRLLLVGLALALGFAVAGVLQRTRLGLTTRAVVRFATFSLGSGLACLAGALITPLSSVDPNMGVPWLVNAFMLVILAGASLLSLMAATVLLGGAQVLVSAYGNPVLGGLTIAVLAAVILRIRPQGFARD